MKPTKGSVTRKLDRVCSEITRAFGKCMMCGLGNYEKLQCCHIFSRTYRNTRWDLKNLLCLCSGCHFRSHKNPIMFTEFVKMHLGDYEYNSLKLKHNAIKRWTLAEMIDYLNSLEEVKNGS